MSLHSDCRAAGDGRTDGMIPSIVLTALPQGKYAYDMVSGAAMQNINGMIPKEQM